MSYILVVINSNNSFQIIFSFNERCGRMENRGQEWMGEDQGGRGTLGSFVRKPLKQMWLRQPHKTQKDRNARETWGC